MYNAGTTAENYRIAEIAEIIREVLDREFDVTYLEDEHPGPSYHVKFDRLNETGFEPNWTLRQGSATCPTNYREQQHDDTH